MTKKDYKRNNHTYHFFKPWIWYVLPAPALICVCHYVGITDAWWERVVDGKVVERLALQKVYK